MDSSSPRLFLLPRTGGGFELRDSRSGAALEKPFTRQDGIRRATVALELRGGGRLVSVTSDGREEVFLVDAAGPRPRWYLPSGLLRWLFPLVFGGQLLLRVLAWRGRPFDVVSVAAFAALFIGTIVLVWTSVRLDRARRPRPEGSGEAVQD